jgi:hypothetical protein
MLAYTSPKEVARWGCVRRSSVPAVRRANPFVDSLIEGGFFQQKRKTVRVNGFYDGNGLFKVRFMHSFAEEYRFTVGGNFAD